VAAWSVSSVALCVDWLVWGKLKCYLLKAGICIRWLASIFEYVTVKHQ